MSKKIDYKSAPSDEEFRHLMRKLIDGAQREILVVTGEGGAFKNYEELKWGIKRASGRGVKVKVYARSPEQSTINKMIRYGGEVFLGEKIPKDHFTVIDKKILIESLEHEPHKVGVRRGSAYFDRKKASAKAKEFKGYIAKAKRAKIDIKADPLLNALKSPPYFGFEIESDKVDSSLV